jgi:septal ring factor EnvC (AmiA/AmiB activator)
LELKSVKEERGVLVASLAHIKTDLTATAGGEAQQGQIVQLEKELELKKLKLNELRTECKRLDNSCKEFKTQIKDAMLLTPGGYEGEYTSIKNLHADMKRLEDDLIEAEAKNR